MAVSLGKRKRHDHSRHRREDEDSHDEEDLRARFQRAFEAKFKPLDRSHRKAEQQISDKKLVDDDDDVGSSGEESGWSGLSDDDDDDDDDDGQLVEIIEHGLAGVDTDEIGVREKKAFMSSKPPISADKGHASQSKRLNNDQKPQSDQNNETDPSEAVNLKNDLALQRLLKESHLLDSSTFGTSSTSSSTLPTGKSRLKALDLRIQDLGGPSGKQPPAKMSMALRKGITAKATRREEKRRKEAAENGVILEKAINPSNPGLMAKKRRERAIGTPNVGRFQGGTLKLSSKDVRSIEGPKERMMGGKKRGRRR